MYASTNKICLSGLIGLHLLAIIVKSYILGLLQACMHMANRIFKLLCVYDVVRGSGEHMQQ